MYPHPHPKIEIARCTGCGRCVAACPGRLITLELSEFRKHAVLVAPTRCNRCLKCVPACPVGALGCAAESEEPGTGEGLQGDGG